MGKKLRKEEMDGLLEQIDSKLSEFIKQGKYKDVLLGMANLGRYSLRNQFYILCQKPDARVVYGLRKWNELGRTIRKGEKALRIFSPILGYSEKDKEEGERVVKGFKLGCVFDLSQTEGDEIRSFVIEENKPIKDGETIIEGMNQVAEGCGYTFKRVPKGALEEECYGLCNHKTKEILVRDDLGEAHFISTFAHELGHALAHSKPREDFIGITQSEKRGIKEVEAESIACIVCHYLCLDTENFNFSYILGWADGEISKFRKNLVFVGECAKTIIDGINGYKEKKAICNK